MRDHNIQRQADHLTNDLHGGGSRVLGPEHEYIGLAGEHAFGRLIGQDPEIHERAHEGDGGVDFRIALEFTVDVKTARRDYGLLHEAGKRFADIFVLALFDDESGTARLVGWTWGNMLRAIPPYDTGRGVINHKMESRALRPMSELTSRLVAAL